MQTYSTRDCLGRSTTEPIEQTAAATTPAQAHKPHTDLDALLVPVTEQGQLVLNVGHEVGSGGALTVEHAQQAL